MSHAAVNDRPASPPKGWLNRFLNGVEKAGNKLPDPAMLVPLRLADRLGRLTGFVTIPV